MGGCSAINCNSHSRKKDRMFRFPADPVRRKLWIINCRRDAWVPGPNAQLCSKHFEENQYEQNREDGWKKLKPNAVPTLFDVPNPPPSIGPMRLKGIGKPKEGSLLHSQFNNVQQDPEKEMLKKRVAELEAENKKLKELLTDQKNSKLPFLSEEQIKYASVCKRSIPKWSDDAILQGLKMRFSLGKFGYNYLCKIGYPTPSYSTLNRKLQHIKMNFGILDSIMPMVKAKVEAMDECDKWAAISVDEMEIERNKDFDVSDKCFVGNVTLGSELTAGNHYTTVMLRGLKSGWKQVIAHEISGPSTDGESMKNLLTSTVESCRNVGLKIKAVSSDMGGNNKGMWKAVGVKVNRTDRQTFFMHNDEEKIHVVADVPHLIKNLRGAILSRALILPKSLCEAQDLPSTLVSSIYIRKLWRDEIDAKSGLRSLHHLNRAHLYPSHFDKMNVATAVQLFSIKTAAALENAVRNKKLAKQALTTAWFIRLVCQWFKIMTARHRKIGITAANKHKKFEFLNNFISIIQAMQFGSGWKPLQTGIVLSTLSVMNLAREAFDAVFTFFLPSRLTQDALENVFFQIRRKTGTKPTALQAKRALKFICVSQFLSDLRGSNYDMTYDKSLLDISSIEDYRRKTGEEEENVVPSAASVSPSNSLLSTSEENNVYYIAGVTLHSILKQKLCSTCSTAAQSAVDNDCVSVPENVTHLTEYADMGGLSRPVSGIYKICMEAEKELQQNKERWIDNEMPISRTNILNILDCCKSIIMPECCGLKEKIINKYFTVRCKGIVKYLKNKAADKACYGSSSVAKKLRT